MSNIARMMQRATAGAAGDPLDIDNVFSTFLYDGNNSTQNIVNSIDLGTEGGMVWSKSTTYSYDWSIYDSARGATKVIASNKNVAEQTYSNGVTAFNNNGYSLGSRGEINSSSEKFVSYTFRKAKNFFDIITYSGDDNSSRSISHSLGSTPGMIWIKVLNSNDSWNVFHRGLENGLGTGRVFLDASNGVDNNTLQFLSANSSSVTFANNAAGNYSGNTYVMYLFGHNNNDGGFGPDGDKDVIKCGSATTPSSAADFEINLGFEPQFILYRLKSASSWQLVDTMQGLHLSDSSQKVLYANQNYHSTQITKNDHVNPTPTGVKFTANSVNQAFGTSAPLIYMAIRRGPLAAPTDATKVFASDTRGSTGDGNEPAYRSTFPVDFALAKDIDSATNWTAKTRLLSGKDLNPNTTSAEQGANYNLFDYMNGHFARSNTASDEQSWMWKRAPSYFDVITWKVDGTGDQTINHNLGVVPEMIWSKNRNDSGSGSGDWWVAHKDLTGWDSANENDRHTLKLNSTAASAQQGYHRDFTSTSIRLLSNAAGGYTTTHTCIAYLFATVAGVSKVGSYTGNGSTQNIDCGFSSGTRFILIKSATDAGSWFVHDSVRGIVAGNDPRLKLDQSDAQMSADYVDPLSSGFTVNGPGNNDNGQTYIFYAIA